VFGETGIWTRKKRLGAKKAEQSATEGAGEQLSLF
jgi:hypothetical protein